MSKATPRQLHQFQPGDRAIWWKRIPGGPYVYPIKVTVLAVTAKRVKVAGDDDGTYVTRFVPSESLQLQTNRCSERAHHPGYGLTRACS
jgi:hypothetical protein